MLAYVGGQELFVLVNQEAAIFLKKAMQFLLSPIAPYLPQAHLEKKKYVTTKKLCETLFFCV